MSRLSDLRAALDEFDAAQDGYDPSRPADEKQYRKFCAIMAAMDRLHELEDIETIRALVEVVEAVECEPHCLFCGSARNVYGIESVPHGKDCPLAGLVKEENDE